MDKGDVMSKLTAEWRRETRQISNLIPHEHSADRRANLYASREQMQFYQEQKESLHKAAADASTQRATEQHKVHQKQIRALRNSYQRRSGLMGSTETTTDKLG
jgi:hypothetical protein